MLIKVIRSWKDDAEKHDDVDLSKRRFMGHSVAAGTTYLTLPTLWSLFNSDKALADAACQAINQGAASNCVNIQIELAGGAAMSMICNHKEKDTGQYVDMAAGTRTLGKWRVNGSNANILSGVKLNIDDSFTRLLLDVTGTGANTTVDPAFQNRFPGLSQSVFNSILSKCKGMFTTKGFNDDSNQNLMHIAPIVSKYSQAQISTNVGFTRSKTVYNNFGGFATIALGTNIGQLTNAVGIGNADLASPAYGTRISTAAQALSNLQMNSLGKHKDAKSIINKANCGIASSAPKYDPNLGSLELDVYTVNSENYKSTVADELNLHLASPSSTAGNPLNNQGSNPNIAVIDPNNATFQGQYARLSAYDSACRNKIVNINYIIGGCDYHNGQATSNLASQNQSIHAQMAIELISALLAAHVNQKRLMITFTTDGGINVNSASPGVGAIPDSIMQGDRGAASGIFTIIYMPTGSSIETSSISGLNMVNQSETADSNHLLSKLPAGVPIYLALNWGALALDATNYAKLKQELQMIAGVSIDSLKVVSGSGVQS